MPSSVSKQHYTRADMQKPQKNIKFPLQVFGVKQYLEDALHCGEVIWQRGSVEEGLRPLSWSCWKRLWLPGPLQDHPGPQTPLQSLHGESDPSQPYSIHDQAKRYDHLPNIVLVTLLLPKQPWPVEAWTPLDPWRCAVVSGTKMLAANPLSPVSWEVGPPWMGLVCSAHPTDAWLDWDLGNYDAKSTPQARCCAPQTIFALWHGALSCWKRPQPPGNMVSMKGYTWSATMLR